jgi:hypothetical protein
VTGEENVPARCAAEQTAALRHLLSNTPKRRRQRILGAEARYLNYERFLAVHSEGLCATWIAAGMGEAPFRGELSCATPAEFQRWGVLVNANFPAPSDLRSSFWTVVPDDVATVTLSFAAGPKPHPFTITVRPVNNVVVTGEPFPRGTFPTPSAIVVRAAGGRLIKKTKNPSQRLPTDCVC